MRQTCYTCKRDKGVHLFGLCKSVCKSCEKKAKAKKKLDMTDSEFIKYKAKQLRANWYSRAKKYSIAENKAYYIPTTKEIAVWLKDQEPYQCWFTGKFLGRDYGVDHLIPLARGGSLELSNLCIIDTKLNRAKGDMLEDEFSALLSIVAAWEDRGASLLKRLQASNNIFRR